MNPRAGNRTSWMGSRNPIFLPKPLENGGKIGVGALGGLGFYSFDLSNPAHPKVLGNVNTPFIWAFTENGAYALSTPLLGEPATGVPAKLWPPR